MTQQEIIDIIIKWQSQGEKNRRYTVFLTDKKKLHGNTAASISDTEGTACDLSAGMKASPEIAFAAIEAIERSIIKDDINPEFIQEKAEEIKKLAKRMKQDKDLLSITLMAIYSLILDMKVLVFKTQK